MTPNSVTPTHSARAGQHISLRREDCACVAVHLKTDRWSAPARFHVTRDRARQWCNAGLVVFGNRGTAVMLTFLVDAKGSMHGVSANPGARVIFANANAERWAREITAAWKASVQ